MIDLTYANPNAMKVTDVIIDWDKMKTVNTELFRFRNEKKKQKLKAIIIWSVLLLPMEMISTHIIKVFDLTWFSVGLYKYKYHTLTDIETRKLRMLMLLI